MKRSLILLAWLIMLYSLPAPAAIVPWGVFYPENPSSWDDSTTAYFGYDGAAGGLTVDGDDDLVSAVAYLGYDVGSSGTVTISGAGSTWTNSGELDVGYGGSGTLNIVNGGGLVSDYCNIGLNVGATGTVTVDGADSYWYDTNSLLIGASGSGTLNITNGANVWVANWVALGLETASTAVIDFGAHGGTLSTQTLYATPSQLLGTGTINTRGLISDIDLVFDHAHGLSQTIPLHDLSGQNVAIHLDMESDPITNGSLGAGFHGTSSLLIGDGLVVASNLGMLGRCPGSSGTATVTGAGSTWSINGECYVGYIGNGILNIATEGNVSNGNGFIGFLSGATGTVTIDGAGSTWTNGGELDVGYNGSGTLNITNGGGLVSGNCNIGLNDGSMGTVTVDGANSTWNAYSLWIGFNGSGALNITNGANVWVTDWVALGYQTASTAVIDFGAHGGSLTTGTLLASPSQLLGAGTINTRGLICDIALAFDGSHGLSQTIPLHDLPGQNISINLDMQSDSNSNGWLGAGCHGAGSLSISGGVAVTSSMGVIGYRPGSSGAATVTGSGSAWTSSNILYVGLSGTGTLNIANRGRVSDGVCFLGSDPGTMGSVTINDTGSSWINNSDLYLGFNGTGTVIQNGGTVSVARTLVLGYDAGGSGTYNLNGGTLAVAAISAGSGPTRAFNFNGGTLQANAGFTFPAEITGTVKSGGAKINTNGYALTINSVLLHDAALGSTLDGGLTKSGAGTLILSGANTYTGDTRINVGMLQWGNANALQNSTLDMNAADSGAVNFNNLNAVLGGLKGSRNLALGTVALTVGGNCQSTTYSGVLSGSGSLTKTGTGSLTLGGSSSNSYSGLTRVNAGTLLLGKTGSATAIANGGLTIGDNSFDVLVQYSDTSTNMMGTGTVTINRRGTLDFNGKTDTIGNVAIFGNSMYFGQIANTAGGGALTISTLGFTGGGAVTTGTGKIVLGGNVTYTAGANGVAAAISGNVDLNANRTFTIADDPALDSELNVSAVIANGSGTSARSLTKNGAGTLTLGGANTYSGGTTLAAGALAVGNDSALGTGTLTFNNGTTIQASGGPRTLSNAITGSGSDFYVKGSFDLTLSGAITAASTCLNIENGSAVLHLTGSANRTVNQVIVGGLTAGESGNCELSGTGQLTVKDICYIGIDGNGTFTQTGGTHTPGGLWLGNREGISGTYNLSESGQLFAGVEIIGGSGTGTFTQTGGANTVTELHVVYGGDGGGNSKYTLSGVGQLSANEEYIGWGSGLGTFTQTGGTNTIATNLFVGGASDGAYNLSGTGQMSANDEYLGYYATGSFTQTGGTNTIITGLTLGFDSGSSGTYNLNGGTLVVNSINQGSGTAFFNFGGGTLRASGDLSTGLSMTLTGSGGNATIDSAGHTVALAGVLYGGGGLNKTGAGTLILGSLNMFSGDTRIASGTLLLANVNALQYSTLDLNAADAGSVDFNGLNPVLGGLKGSRNLALGNSTLTIGRNNLSTVYSGQLSGNGGLVKTGAGVLSLTSNNVYTGDTRVDQGTLCLHEDLSSSSFLSNITVSSGAKLAGTLLTPDANLFVASGGILSPGEAGTHDADWIAAGSITLETGSILDFDGGDPLQSENDVLWGVNSLTLPSHSLLLNLSNASQTGGLVNGTYFLAGSATTIDGFIGGYSGEGTFTVNASSLSNRRYYFEEVNNEILMTILSGQTVWTGGGTDNNWTTAANWGGAAPAIGDPLVFDGATRLNNTNDFAAGTPFGGITFNAGAGAFTLGGNSIALTGDIVNNSSQTQTINLPMLLSGGNRTINTASGNVVLGGTIGESGGSCGLVKTGSSTLTLSETNLYSGGTILQSGVLTLGSDTALGSGALTMGDGTTLQTSGGPRTLSNPIFSTNATFSLKVAQDLTLSGAIDAGSSNMYVETGAAVLHLAGSANRSFNELWVGNDVGVMGNVELGTGQLSAIFEIIGNNGAGTFTQTGGTNTVGDSNGNGGVLHIGLSQNQDPASCSTYHLSGMGQLFADVEIVGVNGTGAFMQTGGTNTMSQLSLGQGTGTSGTYDLSGSGQLSAVFEIIGIDGVGTITQTGGTNTIGDTLYMGLSSNSSGTYNFNGGSLVVNSISQGDGAAVFNFGGGTLQAGGDFSTSLPMTLTGNGGNANVNTAGHNVTFSGILSGNGGLAKTGSGNLTLSGTNLYTGSTVVNAGALEVKLLANAGSGSSLGAPASASPDYLVLAGGTLYYSGVTDASTNRGFTLDGNSAIDVIAGRTVTCSGQIVGDAESDFQKLGSGKLVLNNPAASTVTLANNFTVAGLMDLSGGVTYQIVDWTKIGENSSATMNITGSAALNSNIMMTGYKGGNGTLNLSSSTPLAVDNFQAANSEQLGAATQGVINMTGSSRVNAGFIFLGCWERTEGALNMSNASHIDSGDVILGYCGGNGNLVMNSGTSISSSGTAFLGWGGNGTATLTNASLHAANFSIACGHSDSSSNSVGLLTVNGNSTVTADGDFTMGLFFNDGTNNGSGPKGTTILNDTSTLAVGGEIWVGDQWFSNDLLDPTPYQPEGYLILNDRSIVTSNHSSNRWGVLVGRWGGKGLLEVHDSAQLIVHSGINVGDSWGWNATGLLTGNGTMTVDGAAQVVQDTIGNICLGAEGGAGTWNQNGGTTATTANFWLAEWNSWGDTEILPGTGTLNLNGGTLSVPRICFASNAGPALTTGTVNFNGGTLKATSASSDFISNLPDGGNGSVVCNLAMNVQSGGARIDTNGNSVTIANVLRHDAALGNTPDGGLLKSGAGTLTLAAANTYTGDTRVAAGTLRLGNAGALQYSTLDLNAADAGTVDFNGQDAVLGGLKGSRDFNLGGQLVTFGNNNQSTTYSGQLSNGSFIKTGSGNLTLTANQSTPLFIGYVNQGALTINGQFMSASGLMVMNGATLAGHGNILGGAGLDNGAHLAPDLANVGSLHIDFGYFGSGAVLDYDFGAPGTSDLTVCDDLYFESNVVLNATNLGGFAVGTYNLFESGSIEGFIPGRSGAGTFTLANPPLSNKIYSFAQVGDYIQLIVSTSTQNFTWTGGGADNNLTTPGNWAELPPGDGNPIAFGGTTRLSPNNNYPAGTQWSGITFLADAGAFTLGGNLIKLGGDVLNQSANLQKINCPLTLIGSDRVIDAGTSGVTLGGAIGELGGSFGLIKRGAGALTLTGANTFTGTIYVEEGILSGNASSLRVPIDDAGTVIFDQAADGVYAATISGSGNLRKKGAAKLLLNGPLGLSGKITVEAGTLELGDNIGSTLTCNIDDFATLLVNRTSMLTLDGYLRGAGGLTVQGSGELVLTQLNSLDGAVDVHSSALTILGGTTLAKTVNLAPLNGESGVLRVQGSVTALGIGNLAVGAAGNGSVSITGGADVEINVNQNWITLGQANGGRGSITVDGDGSSLGGGLDAHNRPARPQLLVGGKLSGTSSGVGTLIVENGASADAKSIVLGGSPQSHGNLVRVAGDDSLLTFDELCIGYSSNPGGSGQLQIADGGHAVCTWRLRVGCGEASDGELSVSGTDAVLGGGLDSTGVFKLPGLWIGGDSTSASGTGRVFVENGGRADLAFIMLGQGANSKNNLLQVSGTGSTVTSADVVSVGYPGGGGTVRVQQAGTLTAAQQIKIGAKAGSAGELRVELGGIVDSLKGTSSTDSSGILGYEAGASGSALIRGNGSRWMQDGVLNVGYAGQGQLTIEDGGLVHSAQGVIGRQTGSTGNVTIYDPGSQWQIDGDLHVGGEPFGASESTASLVVRDGGSLSVGGKIHVWNGGVLTLDADTALGVAPSQTVTDSILLSQGTLAASDTFTMDARRGIDLLAPGGIIDVAADRDLTLEGPLSGQGGLTKRGDGDLFLTAVSYAGPTHIEGGNIYFQSGASSPRADGDDSSPSENRFTLNSIEGTGGLVVGDSVTLSVGAISVDTLSIGVPSRFSAPQPVPEPNGFLLLGVAGMVIFLARYRRK